MSNFTKIQDFHAKFDPDPAAYENLLAQRRRFIAEEVKELFEAMEEVQKTPSLAARANLVKELVDVLCVTYGTLALLGVDADAAFAEVHASNMSKTPNHGGKAIKGEGYRPANMERFVQ